MNKRGHSNGYVSPHPKAYGTPIVSPEALERERTVLSQIDMNERVIRWGDANNLPLLILNAVNKSPTTLSCLSITEKFIKGSGFTEDELMGLVIDKDGTTLWNLHCQLTQYLTYLESFAVNFKFDGLGKIVNSYVLGVESCRFVEPEEGSKEIEFIKFNPYFGTNQYKTDYTITFPVWEPLYAAKQARTKAANGKPYPGQVYFCGTVRPPFKFYPVPKYWSGEEWIYVDSQIQQFHKSNLDNGFFQSVLMNVIGNPTTLSPDPRYKTEYTKEDGTKVMENRTVTNAMAFDDMMSATFSGVRKAGSLLATWSSNAENATTIEAFPVTTNFDVLSGTFTDAIRGITIATETPAILANLPQSVNSLGSDGTSMLRAVEIMQSRTEDRRIILEDFYNNVLLANLPKPPKKKVKIKTYTPITQPVTVDKQFWDEMTKTERRKVMAKAGIELDEVVEAAPVEPQIDPVTNEPIPVTKPNEALKTLRLSDWDKITGIKKRYLAGKLSQAEVEGALLSYGFTKEEIDAWLQSNLVEA